MVTNYNSIAELRNKTRAAAGVKSTKVAIIVRENLMMFDAKLNEINEEIGRKQKELFAKHADAKDEIEVVNEKMNTMHSSLTDRNGQVDQELYDRNVESILDAHPSVRPFFDENKEMIDSVLNTEMIVDDFKTIKVDDLPDNLSCNDLNLLAFMLDGLQ